MKVLIITAHDVCGSLDNSSSFPNLLLALAAEGHKVMLLTHDKVNDALCLMYGPPLKSFPPNMAVRRFHIPGDRYIWPVMRKLPIMRSIYNRLRMEIAFPLLSFYNGLKIAYSFRPDLLYGYEIFGSLPAYVLSKILRRKLVLRYQGTLLSFLMLKAKKSLVGKLNVARHYLHLLALKLPADLIIMTNDGTRGDWVLKRLGNKSRMVFWLNGVDFERKIKISESKEQLRDDLRLPKDIKILLSVSRLANWKRVDRIVRALPFIIEKVPDFTYLCVGDGEMRQSLQLLAENLAVEKHVIFAGSVPQKDVIKYMHAADVFISMNDWTNAGNPTFEAMICGMPIVTYDIGDTSKMIHDKENGILLSTDSPKIVAEAVIKLMSDEQLRNRLKKKAQEFAQARFWTWEERMAAEIAELESLLAKK